MQQQNQSMQQSQPMSQVPNIVSTKDQLYLADMLSWNLNACKKAHFFAQNCQTPEIQAALEEAGQMHQRHYDKLLNHLNSQSQTTN
ncbi:hypothetical protein GLV98_06105 [Halobacillus litoralis]|uniref:Rubrerythrin family protein n=2 Tax=Halobacillus TaxID=45667 RepID=A0A845ECR9_9BACI|nr:MULTISPECIES: hypothetical protein [Halobacillus]MBX0357408.1 hypothetical protein [Halobacillus sp. Nhm2S1]MEC3884532.1 hypothetical protein [Halobacillus sp. HZG1]MYL49048.1 hypothetical protein [Halobacillus litoralis]MYL70134.1 hypothetical protein [Halobacillus litoralis]WLR49365.1 hypothetical protein LC065_09605 [Halobacillus litoralis]